MKAYAITLAALLAACSAPPQASQEAEAGTAQPEAIELAAPEPVAEPDFTPPPGSNEMLRAPLTVAEGLEVIISDVVIPPNATVPAHTHPGEEFVYLIERSAVHVEAGQPERVVGAGDALVIPPGVVHSPRGGEDGARAIVFRVHVAGEPERSLVDEPEG